MKEFRNFELNSRMLDEHWNEKKYLESKLKYVMNLN